MAKDSSEVLGADPLSCIRRADRLGRSAAGAEQRPVEARAWIGLAAGRDMFVAGDALAR